MVIFGWFLSFYFTSLIVHLWSMSELHCQLLFLIQWPNPVTERGQQLQLHFRLVLFCVWSRFYFWTDEGHHHQDSIWRYNTHLSICESLCPEVIISVSVYVVCLHLGAYGKQNEEEKTLRHWHSRHWRENLGVAALKAKRSEACIAAELDIYDNTHTRTHTHMHTHKIYSPSP